MNWVPLAPMLLVLAGGAPPAPVAHTYSIVARDPATGELGVAVQSHYFSVGPIVPWAAPGAGAVATQSLVLVDYGPNGLELMRGGMTAQQALDSLLEADPHNEGRQVAMVDAKGGVAAYTGKACIPDAGHHTGAQYSVQANLMANARVWPAMAAAYERAQGDLAERMLQALEAAVDRVEMRQHLAAHLAARLGTDTRPDPHARTRVPRDVRHLPQRRHDHDHRDAASARGRCPSADEPVAGSGHESGGEGARPDTGGHEELHRLADQLLRRRAGQLLETTDPTNPSIYERFGSKPSLTSIPRPGC